MRTNHEHHQRDAPEVDPVGLVTEICCDGGGTTWIRDIRRGLRKHGIPQALRDRDAARVFDWLMGSFSYQGVSDAAAESYIAAHGNVTYRAIHRGLKGRRRACPKLAGFTAYSGCGYRKAVRTCRNPTGLEVCPVPSHDLRRGGLNQAAYSLYFFLRDVCAGDLGGFIDRTVAIADGDHGSAAAARQALLKQLTRISGVSDKLVNMTFSELLIAAYPRRRRWVEVGLGMIAIDTLVHNFLHRTGILRAFKAEHQYGVRCYRPTGCTGVIEQLSQRIDCRQFGRQLPAYAPRFIQRSLWAFCAQQQWNICNGNQIDDRRRCRNRDCPVFADCGRLALRPVARKSRGIPVERV
jgi:hypothetical protein